MKPIFRTKLAFFAYLLCVLLAFTSCGGAATTSPGDTMTLKVVQNSNAIGFFPLYVAQQERFIQAQGLTLNPASPPLMGSGQKMTAIIESNGAELAGGGILTDAFTLSKVDSSIKLLGALTNGFFVDIIVSKHFEQQTHLTEASPLVDKIKALEGKTIGDVGPNSGTQALLVFLFRQFLHLDVLHSTTTLVNVGGTATAALAALSSGRVDALSFFAPAGQQATGQGIGDIFISPSHGDVPDMQGQLHGVFYAKQSVITSKPKAVQAFIRAIAQAETFIHTHPTQAMTLLGTYLQEKNQKTLQSIFNATIPIIPQNPLICQKAYDTANQFHLASGLVSNKLPYSTLVASDMLKTTLSEDSCPS